VRVRGEWVYLYRAVDRDGKTVDFRLSARRDVAATTAFFRKAIKRQGCAPRTITLDGYAASHRAVHEMKVEGTHPGDVKLCSSKYLIGQGHRGIKSRLGPLLGFKRLRNASTTTAGIELLRRIKKIQSDLDTLRLIDPAAPAVWHSVLAY
jgi:transposase-like protein